MDGEAKSRIPTDLASRASAPETVATRRIDDFLDALEDRLGLRIGGQEVIFARCVVGPNAHQFYRSPTGFPLSSRGIDLRDVFAARNTAAHSVGSTAYSAMVAYAALSDGLFGQYGVAAAALLVAICRRREVAARQWHENGLGPLLTDQQPLREGCEQNAALELFGVVGAALGLGTLKTVIDRSFDPLRSVADEGVNVIAWKDPKTFLQEVTQGLGRLPEYFGYERVEPDHDIVWRCRVSLGRSIETEGEGKSKTEAEADAASRLLRAMSTTQVWGARVDDCRERELAHCKADARTTPLHPPRTSAAHRRGVVDALARRGFELDPDYALLALIDPATRSMGRFEGDHRALACVGASLLDAYLAAEIVRQVGIAAERVAELVKSARREFAAELAPSKLRRPLGLPVQVNGRYELDAAQALVAAIAISEGFDAAPQRFGRAMEAAVSRAISGPRRPDAAAVVAGAIVGEFVPTVSYATALQEVTQRSDGQLPQYDTTKTGPDHRPTFAAVVTFDGRRGRGEGPTARAARNRAAYELLVKLSP